MKLLSTVKGLLWLLVFTLTAALLLIGICSFATIAKVKIGGPIYQRIIDSMNVRADILPPPQYLIETELAVYMLADDLMSSNAKSSFRAVEAKLIDLRKQFEDGQSGWDKQLPSSTALDREIRTVLLERNATLGRRYFSLVFKEFLPAVQAGNKTLVAELLHGPLQKTAAEHRAAINNLTALTEKSSQLGETAAADAVRRSLEAILGLIVILGFLSFVVALYVVRSIGRPLNSAILALEKLAQGDLTVSAQTDASGELGKMCAAVNRVVENLRKVITKAQKSAESLSQFSETLSDVSVTVVAGVHQQVNALKDTATHVGVIAELSSSNSANTDQGIDSASRTRLAAETGSQTVSDAISGMHQIQQTSGQIGQIVDTVDEISFYTNLLAVNAAVEAAGAGEHGRGFMIVAQEIRGLAQRTAKAADSIRQLIELSKSAVTTGAERVQQANQSFATVSSAVRELSAVMENVASSITIQSDSLKELNASVTGVASSVDRNNLGTGKISDTSKSLSVEAHAMHELVRFFKL